jgi:multiple sugar transport system permease protein
MKMLKTARRAPVWIERLARGRARKILLRAVMILLLVDVGFIFLMPLLRLISTSLMHVMDLYDPTVVWIPRRWSWENYRLVFLALKYPQTFKNTLTLAGGAAVCAL